MDRNKPPSRCQKICGRERKNCFINNKNQLECLSDIVTNKVFGISSIVRLLSDKISPDNQTRLFTEEITKNLNELINWVKFLQLMHDIKMTDEYREDVINNETKRVEKRYPLPELFHKYIEIKLFANNITIPATLKNFSQSGIQLQIPLTIDPGKEVSCLISTNHPVKKEVTLRGKVIYCRKTEEDSLTGIRIIEVSDSTEFNFFKEIFNFIEEIIKKTDI